MYRRVTLSSKFQIYISCYGLTDMPVQTVKLSTIFVPHLQSPPPPPPTPKVTSDQTLTS